MWVTPKTDWAVQINSAGAYQGDYFEATDFQRISGNLAYIVELALPLYPLSGLPTIPEVTEASFGYASTINSLEQTLAALKTQTFDPGIGATKTWRGNSPGPLASDLNRIENACLLFYDMFTAQAAALPKLEFQMGGSDF